MKIALAQLNYFIGDFKGNIDKIISSIKKAKNQGADLVIFSELSVSGYPAQDFLEFDDFIIKCDNAVKSIAKECDGIAAVIGSPSFNKNNKGKRLLNSAFFLADGKILSIANKALMPNYDIFDEYRYFEPAKDFNIIKFKDKKIALTICEDLWAEDDRPLYPLNPMEELIKQNPDFIINIAASPFSFNQAKKRKEILVKNSKKYHLPLFYVNHVGAQTEILFDGGSLVINEQGKIIDEFEYFKEDFRIYDTNNLNDISNKNNPAEKIQLIHDALIMGISNYFQKLNFKKAILGLSGGIDSAVTLVLAAKALGNKNLKAILLPSEFSSDHSVNDAVALAENLNVDYNIISIKDIYNASNKTLKPYFNNLPFNIAEENLQARIRGLLLMAFSNKYGYILLNTSNKSEAAVGYGTLYGDMCGGLSVLGDVYKTDVFKLAKFINKEKEIIPNNTINKPPSAELRPNQKDSDSLPDYDILDKILYNYIELHKGPEHIINLGFDENIVRKVLKLVNINEYKRRQTPPILRVSSKAFGMGRRMPVVAKYLL
ncbi:MAG: NAD+ synthase [Bacteroidales bacterium]|nr:NAD+ synthase [Bacteroidales bacterium]